MIKTTTQELLSKFVKTDNNKYIYKGNRPCILDFSAEWCMPCKSQKTQLINMSKKYTDIDFFEIDVEEEYELAELFSIRSLPTVMYCEKEIKQFVGFTPISKIESEIKKQSINA